MTNENRDLELFTISELLKTENGRKFIFRCLQSCYTFENIFDENPIKHAYNAGLRSHGLWLDSEVREASIDNYFKMMKENNNE